MQSRYLDVYSLLTQGDKKACTETQKFSGKMTHQLWSPPWCHGTLHLGGFHPLQQLHCSIKCKLTVKWPEIIGIWRLKLSFKLTGDEVWLQNPLKELCQCIYTSLHLDSSQAHTEHHLKERVHHWNSVCTWEKKNPLLPNRCRWKII